MYKHTQALAYIHAHFEYKRTCPEACAPFFCFFLDELFSSACALQKHSLACPPRRRAPGPTSRCSLRQSQRRSASSATRPRWTRHTTTTLLQYCTTTLLLHDYSAIYYSTKHNLPRHGGMASAGAAFRTEITAVSIQLSAGDNYTGGDLQLGAAFGARGVGDVRLV